MPVIRISDANFQRMQDWALPIVDSADDALGKVLDAAEAFRDRDTSIETSLIPVFPNKPAKLPEPEAITADMSGSPRRLPKGQKTPNKAYERPILEAVYELGGRGSMADVLKIVERKMVHVLNEIDYQILPSGGDVRWRNTAQFARNGLVKRGLLKSKEEAGWGIWELTEKGIAEVEKKQR